MGFSQKFEVQQTFEHLIMKSLICATLIFGAAVVVNATGTAPPPPPPPPPAPPAPPLHYRPPVHYRPRYGPPSHGGGLEGILPLLLLGKNGGHGSGKGLLPLLLLSGGLGGKGGKGGLGGNPLLLPLLLGKNCKDPHNCVKPNTHNTLCGAGMGNKPCCVCSGGNGLFGA